MPVPTIRIAAKNDAPLRPARSHVLYWMTAARRTRFNFGLDRAAEAARSLRKPLLVLEGLRCDYRWASARHHTFVIDGMADNRARFAAAGVTYLPFVEREAGAGRGLLAALAADACLVVTDDFPSFFLPRMVAAAAGHLDVRLEAVDSNGLLPMADAERDYPTAYAFRRHLQTRLPAHLACGPEPDPLARPADLRGAAVPARVAGGWSFELPGPGGLPIDQRVGPVPGVRGGEAAARERLACFVAERLRTYAEERNQPERDGTSGLSPYLHFGHLGIHEVLLAIAALEGWSPDGVSGGRSGRREGWWGMSAPAEAFLDQAVTWRELGYNFCARRPGYDRFESLPDWARRTLAEHAGDPREPQYGPADLRAARTYDPLWNAAQRQLVREGRIHGYLRMLWGKKILEWSRDPEEALETMIELNNAFALDGRNPNSYSGIFWVLGRYDRPWGPSRPVFGTIRYMSSKNTARKMPVEAYLRRYAPDGAG